MSCPYSKDNISALNTPRADAFSRLFQMLGEEDYTRSGLMERGHRLFDAMYLVTTNHNECGTLHNVFKEEGKAWHYPSQKRTYIFMFVENTFRCCCER